MKTTFFAALALLPAMVLGAPSNVEARDNYGKSVSSPFTFTKVIKASAYPDKVVNANSTSTPGEPGAFGWFTYGLNVPQDIICYNITVYISGDYMSPAATATHIHQGALAKNGPPRIAFPNPTIKGPIDEFGRRVSVGCLQGPFTTGLAPNGTDTGLGFTVAQLAEEPSAFFTDVHTVAFPAGAIRGQLS